MPATTLGNCDPMWILWIITFMSTVLPDTASPLCGVWQITHSSIFFRSSCICNGSWHLLQLCVRITSRVTVTGLPSGTQL